MNTRPQAPSLPLEGFAPLNDTPVACQIREPTRRETGAPISRRRQPPPTHCGASRRNGRDLIIAKNDQRTRSYPRTASAAAAQRAISRPGASVSFVSDGPISSNSGRNGGKNAGRNAVSALPQRATVGYDFPHLLAGITFHHRCQSKGLRVRSPARRLTRPLASATAGVFRSYRHPPKPSPRVAHPLKPSPWGVRGIE